MAENAEALLDLARDRTAEGRRLLVENITDLFLSREGRLSDHERSLMSDILNKLIDGIETDLRRDLSTALARSGVEMPDLARHLAHDEIGVAWPLLQQTDLLKEADLIEIIRFRTEEHRIAIAGGQGVSEAVSEALIDFGGHDALEALVNNPDAAISRRAMTHLVAEARRYDSFHEPLLNRHDLPSDLAYRLYWYVSAALRRHILQRFEIDEVQLDEGLRRANQVAEVHHAEATKIDITADRLVRRMQENGDLTFEFLLNTLRQGHLPVFVAGFALMAQIDQRTIWRVVTDRGGESQAVLARAVGMEKPQFTTMALLTASESARAQSTAVLEKLSKIYESVSQEKAQKALKIWQRDFVYEQAQEQLKSITEPTTQAEA